MNPLTNKEDVSPVHSSEGAGAVLNSKTIEQQNQKTGLHESNMKTTKGYTVMLLRASITSQHTQLG